MLNLECSVTSEDSLVLTPVQGGTMFTQWVGLESLEGEESKHMICVDKEGAQKIIAHLTREFGL